MKVLFVEFAVPFWFRVAEDLRARDGINPVDWKGGGNHMSEEFAQRFYEAHFLDLADVKRNFFRASFSFCQYAPLDMHCRCVWQDQFHRWDRAGNFNYARRTNHYYQASGLLDFLKPDAVIFRTAPHATNGLILHSSSITR